jgi:hypothetical protein
MRAERVDAIIADLDSEVRSVISAGSRSGCAYVRVLAYEYGTGE